jgi:hypothetical protein
MYRRQKKVISVLPIDTPVIKSSVLSIYFHKWVKNAILIMFSGFLLPKSCQCNSRVFFGRWIFFFQGKIPNMDDARSSLRLSLARVTAANRKVSHRKMLFWNYVLNRFPVSYGANFCFLTPEWHVKHLLIWAHFVILTPKCPFRMSNLEIWKMWPLGVNWAKLDTCRFWGCRGRSSTNGWHFRFLILPKQRGETRLLRS